MGPPPPPPPQKDHHRKKKNMNKKGGGKKVIPFPIPPQIPNPTPKLARTLKDKAFHQVGVAKMVGNESSQVNRVHTHRSTRFQLSSLRRNILSLCRSRGIGESSAGVCELCNYQASAGSVLPRKHPIIRHCRLSLC